MHRFAKIVFIASATACGGCASLTQSQLNEVNAFGNLTSGFSAYPGTIVSTVNRIHVQSEIYGVNSQDNAEKHVEALGKIHSFIDSTNIYTAKIDLSIRIIEQYAQGLVLLTSNSHNKALDTAATSFGTNLDGLITTYNKVDKGANIPTGIGSAVAAVISLGGDAYIRSKQAEDVKKVVPAGDVIIGKMTDNLLEFLGPEKGADTGKPSLQQMISEEKRSVIIHYKKYLLMDRDEISINKDNDQYKGFLVHKRVASITDDQNILQMLADLDNAEVLRVQCIRAVTDLRKAHARLLQDIQQKMTITQYAHELLSYSSQVQNAYNTLKAIK